VGLVPLSPQTLKGFLTIRNEIIMIRLCFGIAVVSVSFKQKNYL